MMALTVLTVTFTQLYKQFYSDVKFYCAGICNFSAYLLGEITLAANMATFFKIARFSMFFQT